jgi:hypothetical protein
MIRAQPIEGRSSMSINPVGGASPVTVHQPVASTAKLESGEAPGAADHDGDADNGGTPPAARAAAVTLPGTMNVKA